MRFVVFLEKNKKRRASDGVPNGGEYVTIGGTKLSCDFKDLEKYICDVPLMWEDKKLKKIFFQTAIFSDNHTSCLGRMIAEIDTESGVVFTEEQKHRIILNAYTKNTIDLFPVSLPRPLDLVQRLSQVLGIFTAIREVLKTGTRHPLLATVTLPKLDELLTSAMSLHKHYIAQMRETIEDIKASAFIGSVQLSPEMQEIIDVKKSFIHQANKMAAGISANDLHYLFTDTHEPTRYEIDETINMLNLSALAARRLIRMIQDLRLYRGKTRDLGAKHSISEVVSMVNGIKVSHMSSNPHADICIVNRFCETAQCLPCPLEQESQHGSSCPLEKKKILKIDVEILYEIIETLVGNAVEALQTKGGVQTIHIGVAKEPDGTALISIDDSGEGFPAKEKRDMLFKAGYTTKSINTGLGLGIAKSLTEKMGGTIALENSKSLGGARVELRFPLLLTKTKKKT